MAFSRFFSPVEAGALLSFLVHTIEEKVPAKSPETEATLVARLRAGDEIAFAELVDQLHARLMAMARTFTSAPALAEDIVQETWLAVIRGLHGFEGRSSLRTWIFSILVRRARTLTSREARRAEVPAADGDAVEVEWEPGRGRIGLWTARPVPWGLEDPAAVFQTREALVVLREALERLPATQRQAVLLRDVEDLSAVDVCNVLQISETNQRVLLHRGRARIRGALDRYLRGDVVFRPSATAAGNPTRGETGAGVTLHAKFREDEDGNGMR